MNDFNRIKTRVFREIQGFSLLFFPPRCLACGSNDLNTTQGLCENCLATLTHITPPICDVCGKPIPTNQRISVCPDCHKNPPNYAFARSALEYGGEIERVLKKFKYGDRPSYARFLGRQLFQLLKSAEAELTSVVLIPVPLYVKRLKQRGYNQSLLLAREIGRRLKIGVDFGSLKRIKNTRPQTELHSAAERYENVKDAFFVKKNRFLGKNILLIDDVITTGSTVNECAKALKKGGAGQVGVLSVARALS